MFCQGNLQMNCFFYLRVCCSVWRWERSLRLLQLFLHNFQFTTATPTSFPSYIIPSCLILCSSKATVPKGFSPLCILNSTLWFEMRVKQNCVYNQQINLLKFWRRICHYFVCLFQGTRKIRNKQITIERGIIKYSYSCMNIYKVVFGGYLFFVFTVLCIIISSTK